MTPESMRDVWGSDSGLWERNENCGRKGSLTQPSSTVTAGAPEDQDFGRTGGDTWRNEASPLPLGEWRGVHDENKEVNSNQGI